MLIIVFTFEILEFVGLTFGHINHLLWKADEFSDMDSKGLVADACDVYVSSLSTVILGDSKV